MIGEFGEAIVMDWGVASSINGNTDVAGTHGFMAPEQLRGEPADPRADIRAGIDVGRDRHGQAAQSDREEAAAANPADRYATTGELANDVAHFIDGQPVIAYRENILERIGRWIRRNLALVAIVLAYLNMRTIVFFWIRR